MSSAYLQLKNRNKKMSYEHQNSGFTSPITPKSANFRLYRVKFNYYSLASLSPS